jgi:DNA polymerase I-like protein with 3'-5' exonuclease and polymerase domains
MSKTDLQEKIQDNSEIVYKTVATKCMKCYGSGFIKKIKKDGTPYKNDTKCPSCDGSGYLFTPTNKVAGLKFKAPSAKWVSANGFSVNKNMLGILQRVAKRNKSDEAYNFLNDLQRLSALDTYLSSFVEGINTYIKDDGKLHVRLLQHRTATGRFSGAEPNMQNMPRGGTFPVKKVFISRWEGGMILEADFAQLEFRTAAYLSQDETAMKEIENGFDVHSYTQEVISNAGQKISRQEAKAHTFAPLFGATGFGRSPAEATYYEQFTKKYKGIALWHSRLAKEAVTHFKIKTPSGREFAFPDVSRRTNGGVTHFTQIKNYPVQSFATADIVPLILMDIDRRLNGYKSCVVNTVHDSIVIDVHPDEVEVVKSIIKYTNNDMTSTINEHFNIDLNVPLLLEAKIGKNWLDMQDVM